MRKSQTTQKYLLIAILMFFSGHLSAGENPFSRSEFGSGMSGADIKQLKDTVRDMEIALQELYKSKDEPSMKTHEKSDHEQGIELLNAPAGFMEVGGNHYLKFNVGGSSAPFYQKVSREVYLRTMNERVLADVSGGEK